LVLSLRIRYKVSIDISKEESHGEGKKRTKQKGDFWKVGDRGGRWNKAAG